MSDKNETHFVKTLESETARADQISLNFHWLLNKMDAVHSNLCPGIHATWIKRAEQSVEAAEKISKQKNDEAISLSRSSKKP